MRAASLGEIKPCCYAKPRGKCLQDNRHEIG